MAHNGDSSSESIQSEVDSNSDMEYGLTPEDIEALFAEMDATLEEERRAREAQELAALLEEEQRLSEEVISLMELMGLNWDMFNFVLVEAEGWEDGDALVFLPSEDEDSEEEDVEDEEEESLSGDDSSSDDSDFFD